MRDCVKKNIQVQLFVEMTPVEPVLKQALGHAWSALAPVIQAHYGLTTFTDEQVRLKGKMDRVYHARIVSPLMPIVALARAMLPYQGHNVRIEAVNYSPRIHSHVF